MADSASRLLKRFRWSGATERMHDVSWRDALAVAAPAIIILIGLGWMAVRFLRPAPPSSIRMLAGAEGSTYRTNADRYKKILEGYGVKVEILTSHGALENLQQLANPKLKVDVAFVQGGLTDGVDISNLMSLGSLFPQPLLVFHHQNPAPETVAGFKGQRLAIGPEGSGTRALALKLLKATESDGPPTRLFDLGGEDAARALVAGDVDAVFLTGDSATPQVMRKLRDITGVQLFNFRQAAGFARRFRFLSRLSLPEGALDLARDYPPAATDLVAATVELVARRDLHPAVSDLLISAAREIHGGASLFRDAGEYPAPLVRDFPISPDAERYYKSGGQFLYKRLPFWLASLVDRLLVFLVPLFVLILPATRVAPAIYRWRVRSRIYRWYGALMAIERERLRAPSADQDALILKRLDDIEAAVDEIKTPLSFADQLYVLRSHIAMVRDRLGRSRP